MNNYRDAQRLKNTTRDMVQEDLEKAANLLARENLVEEAWTLRGFADAVLGEFDREEADGPYGNDYRRGYNAGEGS